jgi:hypothetical protein
VATGAWSVSRLKAGGFTSGVALNAGISDAVTALRASMHLNMRRRQDILLLPALNLVKIGFLITRSSE